MNPAILIRPLVERFDPYQVVLFGSRARGDHKDYSDFDLLVVMESLPERWETEREMHDALRTNGEWVDLKAVARSKMREKIAVPGSLYRNAAREGVVLHGPALPPVPPLDRRSLMNDKSTLEDAEVKLGLAKTDLDVAQFLLKGGGPGPHVILFHIQQAVEKAVKADLTLRRVDYKPTHNLKELTADLPAPVRAAVQEVASWEVFTDWAVKSRYAEIGTEDVLWKTAEGAIEPAGKVVSAVARRVREERARLKRKSRGR